MITARIKARFISRARSTISYFEDPFISSLGIFIEDGSAIDAEVMAELRAQLSDFDLLVQDNAGLRAGALEVFDRTFSITVALRLLTTLVAFIGILSALMALQLERAREYGVMRATGTDRASVDRIRHYSDRADGLGRRIAGAAHRLGHRASS